MEGGALMERETSFNKVIIFGILFLMILFFSVICFASVDLSKDIAALKHEIKTAQEKINRAKVGETLDKITIPVSIRNMQKILGSLSQKASGDQNLIAKVKNLNSSLNSLEGAKNRNDKSGAQKILGEMFGTVAALEKEGVKLPPTALQKREQPPGKVGGSDTIAYGPGVDLCVSRIELIHASQVGKPGDRLIIRPSIQNMWTGETSSQIRIHVAVWELWPGGRIKDYSCHIVGGLRKYEEKKAHWCGEIDFSDFTQDKTNYRIIVSVDLDNEVRENNEWNNSCNFGYVYSLRQLTDPYEYPCFMPGPHGPPKE